MPLAIVSDFSSFQASPLLLSEDVTGRIFVGGIGIILSGIVGSIIVAFLVRDKLDLVRSKSTVQYSGTFGELT